MRSPLTPSFSGKLSNTTITWWHRDSPEAPEPLAQSTTYKSLKYHVYCVTVGFRTVAAASPTRPTWRTNSRRRPKQRSARRANRWRPPRHSGERAGGERDEITGLETL